MELVKEVVGVDVSKDSLMLCIGTIATRQNQSISKSVTFANTTIGFKKLLSWSKRIRTSEEIPLWFVMEATGIYYENLAFFLS